MVNKMNGLKFHLLYAVLIVLSSYVMIGSFINHDLVYEHDIMFHLNRIIGMENFWHSPVNFNTFNHSGKGVSLFYPSYFLYITEIFYKIFHSYIKAIKFYNIIVVLIAGFSAYFAGWKYFKNEHKSAIFAVLFLSSQYFVTNIYLRFAIGEYTSYAFLPLVLVGVYYLLFEDSKKWYIATLGFVMVGVNHVLSLALCIGIAAILFIMSAALDRKNWNMIRIRHCILFTFSVILSLLFVIVPLVEQTKTYEIYTTTPFLSFGGKGVPIFDFFMKNLSISINLMGLGPIVVIISFLNMLVFKRLSAFEKSILVISWIFIYMQLDIFPWKLFDNSIILVIQFVFRLNVFITLFNAFVFSKTVFILLELEHNKKVVIKMMLITLSIICFQISTQYAVIRDAEKHFDINYKAGPDPIKNWKVPRFSDKIMISKAEVYNNFDYLSKKSTQPIIYYLKKNYKSYIYITNTEQRKKLIQNISTKILQDKDEIYKNPTFTNNDWNLSFKNKLGRQSNIIVPLTLYKGIHILVNDKYVTPNISKRGWLQFTLPKDKNINIKIWYSWTRLARISQMVSMVSIVLVIFYFVISEIKFFKTIIHKFIRKK